MFAEIVLPINVASTLTYGIPLELQSKISVGMRVEVALGKNKLYSGIVIEIHNNKPELYAIKPIKRILDNYPIVDTNQIKFWKWISQYYLASLGDVMNAALPSHFKLMSETILHYNETFDLINNVLSDDTYIVAEALQLKKKLTIQEIRNLIPNENLAIIIDEILHKNIAFVIDTLEEKYTPKLEKYYQLNPKYNTDEELNKLFNNLEKQEKQLTALMHFLYLNKLGKNIKADDIFSNKKISKSAINTLIKKEILLIEYRNVDRIQTLDIDSKSFELENDQVIAKQHIIDQWKTFDVVLLHGVTGSGKTMIYIDLIKSVIDQNKTALLLLPEIALTTQMVQRLLAYFGKELGVYHSKINQQERIEIWNNINKKKIKVVIGPRSAIWLPYKDLDLIIIDEEHEPSFKQVDPSPRFHARDSAIYLANIHNSKVLLGSATPSVESMYNVQTKKYGYVSLKNRYKGVALPIINIVNAQNVQPALSSHITTPLLEAIQHHIHIGQQVILFQNKRGYAPFVICGACGWIPHCKYCDISMTYHKHSDQLHCHYCNTKSAVFKHCPKCSNTRIISKNFGTEKIEEDLQRIFPKLRIGRMDWDAAKTPKRQKQLLNDFDLGRIDILVGTQMIIKGIDFTNVGLVGILSSDAILSFPDFRVNERGFQIMKQVSGRAGRSDGKGQVIIQAYNTQHPILSHVISHNFKAFYLEELAFRNEFKYPPFIRLIKIICKHKKEELAKEGAIMLANKLIKISGLFIQGPTPGMIARIKTYFHEEILIKISKEAKNLQSLKYEIAKCINEVSNTKGFSGMNIVINIDPY